MFPKFIGAEILEKSEHMNYFLNIIQRSNEFKFSEKFNIFSVDLYFIQPIFFSVGNQNKILI